MKNICIADTPIDDGLNFDADNLKGILIKEDADYEGVRVVFIAYLGTARVNMQIDIGFGDEVFPAPKRTSYPTVLDFPAPKILSYRDCASILGRKKNEEKFSRFCPKMKVIAGYWLNFWAKYGGGFNHFYEFHEYLHSLYSMESTIAEKFERVTAVTKRGDVLLFERNLLHMSTPNITNQYSFASVCRIWEPTQDLTLSGEFRVKPYNNDFGRPGIDKIPKH